MKPINIKAAKSLVSRYERITLREIEEISKHSRFAGFNAIYISEQLTGFGDVDTCSLCKTIKEIEGTADCRYCIYEVECGCQNGSNYDSYYAIYKATTPKELHAAFRARAKHIKGILEKLKTSK